MDKFESNLHPNLARFCWIGAVLTLVVLEVLVVFSQFHKLRFGPRSLHYFYVPVMLTLPLSAIAPLYLRARAGRYGVMNEDEQGRLSFVASFSLLVAYLTLLVCVGEFL